VPRTGVLHVDDLEVEVTVRRVKRMNVRVHPPDGAVRLSVPPAPPTAPSCASCARAAPGSSSTAHGSSRRSSVPRVARSPSAARASAARCGGASAGRCGSRSSRRRVVRIELLPDGPPRRAGPRPAGPARRCSRRSTAGERRELRRGRDAAARPLGERRGALRVPRRPADGRRAGGPACRHGAGSGSTSRSSPVRPALLEYVVVHELGPPARGVPRTGVPLADGHAPAGLARAPCSARPLGLTGGTTLDVPERVGALGYRPGSGGG
jgi:hypothetical protein